jgi:hypothetical protein
VGLFITHLERGGVSMTTGSPHLEGDDVERHVNNTGGGK